MTPYLRLVTEQDRFDCSAVTPEPAEVQPPMEPPIPGSRRREWVYREMGLLGPEATPWLERLD
jgi:hypothetical protein